MNLGRMSVACVKEFSSLKSGEKPGVPEFLIHGLKPIHGGAILSVEISEHNALTDASNGVCIKHPFADHHSA